MIRIQINDRFIRGLTAGLIAGIIQDVLDYSAYLLDLAQLRYLDWVGVMIFGRIPITLPETLLALGGELFFSGILGIMFAYLVPYIRSSNTIIKSWTYGVGSWFSIYGVMTLFKVRGLEAIDVTTASADVVTSSAYGLVLGYTLLRIDRKSQVDNKHATRKKYYVAPSPVRKQEDKKRKVRLIKPKKL